jgi:hypothetical protein
LHLVRRPVSSLPTHKLIGMLRITFSLLEGNFYNLKCTEYCVEGAIARVANISIKTKQAEVLNITWAYDIIYTVNLFNECRVAENLLVYLSYCM